MISSVTTGSIARAITTKPIMTNIEVDHSITSRALLSLSLPRRLGPGTHARVT